MSSGPGGGEEQIASDMNPAGSPTHSFSSPTIKTQEVNEDDLTAMEKITKLKTQWLTTSIKCKN